MIRCPDKPCAICKIAVREINSYCLPCNRTKNKKNREKNQDKPCSMCNESPRLSNHGYCRMCSRVQLKESRERRGGSKALHLFWTYGLTIEQYDQMVEKQNGLCANPGCWNDLQHTDHNHETGKVRGLLCSGCNKSLGLLKEDIDRILGLISYLKGEF